MSHEPAAIQDASIIHVNITDFFASLAAAKDRSLNRKAFVIAPDTYGACAIINTSEGARKEGIERGMSVAQAFRLVPHLTVLPPDIQQAQNVQRELLRIAQHYSPAIEHDMRGHLYLDAKGTRRLFGPPRDIAMDLSSHIRENLSITPSVGIASNRLVAKIATRAIRPSAVTAIAVGEETALPQITGHRYPSGAHPFDETGARSGRNEKHRRPWPISMRLRPCCSSEETALPSDVLPSVKTFQRGASILLKTIRSRPGSILRIRANTCPTIEGGIFQILEEAWTQLRARDEEAERVELTIVYADRQTSTLSAAVPGELLYDDQLISYGRETSLQSIETADQGLLDRYQALPFPPAPKTARSVPVRTAATERTLPAACRYPEAQVREQDHHTELRTLSWLADSASSAPILCSMAYLCRAPSLKHAEHTK